MKIFVHHVCHECGVKHGKGSTEGIATMHEGRCDICGKKRILTAASKYGIYRVEVEKDGKDD